MALFLDILKVLAGLIAGGIIGFFIARKVMKKYSRRNYNVL